MKWKELHDEWKAKHCHAAPSAFSFRGCLADDLFLHLPRERDVWDKLRTTVGQADQFVCDLSQSLGRNRERTDGKVPTITPGSHLILGSEGRALLPHEALLLHAFPLHKMTFPSCISATDLENMGGNTMHCQVVGIAMVIALLLVNWELPAAHQSLPAAVAASAPSAPLALEAAKRLEERLRKRFGMQPPTWSKVARNQNSGRLRVRVQKVKGLKGERRPKWKKCLVNTRRG